MNLQASQHSRVPPVKLEDSKRVQRILDELNAKMTDRKTGINQQIVLDDKAHQMFMDYANELTISLLEASSLLAQHRGAKTIDVDDINMILSKKLGIQLPGYVTSRHAAAAESAMEEGGAPGAGSR